MIGAATVLLLLRLLAALLLLMFLGALVYFLQREIRLVERQTDSERPSEGYLTLEAPGALPQRYRLRPIMSIGRILSNSIVLDNSYTSAQHALLTKRDGHWWVEDLQSRNGTLVNDVEIAEPVIVSSGDIITIGDVRLRLELSHLERSE